MKKEKVKKNKKNKNQNNEVQTEELVTAQDNTISLFDENKSNLKDLMAPSGIDATHYDYLEIFSKISRYARTFYVTTLPRQATFPYFLSGVYEFGDVNTSVYITPIPEPVSQKDLNKTIVELQSERFVAQDRGDINRASVLADKQSEAEALRDQIAAGYNKLFETTIVATLFAYSKNELDKASELLAMEASKNMLGIKALIEVQWLQFFHFYLLILDMMLVCQ